jgi:hypothetical protein
MGTPDSRELVLTLQSRPVSPDIRTPDTIGHHQEALLSSFPATGERRPLGELISRMSGRPQAKHDTSTGQRICKSPPTTSISKVCAPPNYFIH